MKNTLLLDLDKTLVNVMDYVDYCAALNELSRFLGREPSAQVPNTYWGECVSKTMEILVGLSGSADWEKASQLVERYEMLGAVDSKPMPGLRKLTQELPHFKRTAVVTLLTNETAWHVLRMHGINVNLVVGREGRLRPKPYPDQLVEALNHLGSTPKESVMVGDSEWDERAAWAAGVDFIAVTNGRENHGFKTNISVVKNLEEACDVLRLLRISL
ncbi:MAG: HAD hydrolase-like protein [Candidatus Caldarchaeum sp.]